MKKDEWIYILVLALFIFFCSLVGGLHQESSFPRADQAFADASQSAPRPPATPAP